jgi:mevalonate pyrophosphate decarboxylase
MATVDRWFSRFKVGNFFLDDENKPERPLSDFAQVISQFLRDEPFPSVCVLKKRLAPSSHTIKEIVARDLHMRQFQRRWALHKLTPASKAKRVEDARTLLQALRSDSEKHFAHIMTSNQNCFYSSHESPTIFGHGRY